MQDDNELLRVTLYRNIDNSVDWFEPFEVTGGEIYQLIAGKCISDESAWQATNDIMKKLKGDGISNSTL
jgi:hypothetical protein